MFHALSKALPGMGFSLLMVVLLSLQYSVSFANTPEPAVLGKLPEVSMTLAGETFELEVAVTQADLLRGLMYRESLPAKHGMLFSFNPSRAVTFWMKNTRVPLDMVFIRNKLVVNVVHSAPPCTSDPCPTFDSLVPVDMVVELPGGTVKQYGIALGDYIQFAPKNQSATTPPASTPATGEQPVDVFPVKPSESQ